MEYQTTLPLFREIYMHVKKQQLKLDMEQYECECEVTQSCLTLCMPMDCSLPGSFVHGIFQARILEWVAISFSRRSSRPRDWTPVSHIVGRHFTIWATREASMDWFKIGKRITSRLYIATLLTYTHTHIYIHTYIHIHTHTHTHTHRVHHAKCQAGWSISWNQDYHEKYQ